jgi:hypothetical protein
LNKFINTILGLFIILGLTACSSKLPRVFENTSYKEYRTYPKNKALAYVKDSKSNRNLFASCKDMKSEVEAKNCALSKCENLIKIFMSKDKVACKIYDLNNKVISK